MVLRLHVVRPCICPSIRLSVTLVDHDHIGWKSWKLFARTISPTPSLFVAQRTSTYSHGTWGNLGEIRSGVGKSSMLEHKSGNITETRKNRGKVTMEGLEELTNALSNGTIADPQRPSLPQFWGFTTPPKTPITINSGMGETMDCKFGRYIHRVHPNKSPCKILKKRECRHIQRLPNFLGTPYYLRNRYIYGLQILNHIHGIDRNKSPLKFRAK